MVEQGTENPRVVGSIPTGGTIADLAHLVERDLAKVEVAGSSPVIRSTLADTNHIIRIRISFLSASLPRRSFRYIFMANVPLIFIFYGTIAKR